MADTTAAPLPRLLTAREVADQTGLPLQRVYEMARTGELPALRFGRAMRFNASELRERLTAGAGA
ncbi:MAG: helix-turn-helix domain-containing protein [Gemmatimonadota bacterium]